MRLNVTQSEQRLTGEPVTSHSHRWIVRAPSSWIERAVLSAMIALALNLFDIGSPALDAFNEGRLVDAGLWIAGTFVVLFGLSMAFPKLPDWLGRMPL